MFDRLFKYRVVVARHRDGPHARARERFLQHCQSQGYSDSMLRKIAWQLLVVVQSIHVGRRRVDIEEIERAAAKPARFMRRRASTASPRSARQMFIHIATGWLIFLGRLQQSPTAATPFGRQIGEFARYMREERGLSPVTIHTRCERMAWFFASLHSRRRRSLRAMSIADVDAFMAAKSVAGWSRGSLDVLAGSLRSFFRYAEAQHWCAAGIAAAIEGPRIFAQERLPRGPTWEEVRRLLDSTAGESPAQIRDHAILMLLALYGLRRGEVARLRLDDVDWDREVISVTRPKQRCTQYYPLLPLLGEALLRYLQEIRPRCVHRELFLTLSAPVRPLSAQSVTPMVHARLAAIGVTIARRGAHCLRHACATRLLTSGFSLKQIGDHLGHHSADSTFNYAKVDLAGLRQVAELDMETLL